MSRPWQVLRALRLRLLGPAKELVGTDQFGNKYYRVPKHETRAGQIIQERRFVEAINRQAYQYEMGDFPTEWEAWIRKKRQDPPTIEVLFFLWKNTSVTSQDNLFNIKCFTYLMVSFLPVPPLLFPHFWRKSLRLLCTGLVITQECCSPPWLFLI
ncbi:NADH dehydrogenase [ubiquinone] 1 alpha subcomplex assembly factor 2 isoform 2-T2 [Theristicus caerulescens]